MIILPSVVLPQTLLPAIPMIEFLLTLINLTFFEIFVQFSTLNAHTFKSKRFIEGDGVAESQLLIDLLIVVNFINIF